MDLITVLDKHVNDVHFTGVYVYQKELVYIRAQLKSLNAKGVDHTLMIRCKNGEWGQYMVEAPSISHCLINDPELKILLLIPDGHVHVGAASGFVWEQILDDSGPNSLKMMTDMQVIDNDVYAVGMGRMIYRRKDSQWSRFDAGIRELKKLDAISGFKSIHGFNENELYAVGFKGEIWYFENEKWVQVSSPTNLKLEKVVCASDNQVYACGGGGILLRGKKDCWELIEQDLTTSTLWGLQEFNKSIYFSDNSSVYQYNGDECKKVDMGLERGVSCSYLHANDGVMWSVGNSHITRYDGEKWEQLF